MGNITAKEVMEKIDMFQAIFGKLDEFGWWDMERIQTDAGMKFTSKVFHKVISIHAVKLSLEAPNHQETNDKFELIWKILQTTSYSIMVNIRVSDEYIYFSLMYTTDPILLVLKIKHFVNQDGETTAPHKLATRTTSSVSNLRV